MPRVPGCCARALPAVATTSRAARNRDFDLILTSWLVFNVTSGVRTLLRRRLALGQGTSGVSARSLRSISEFTVASTWANRAATVGDTSFDTLSAYFLSTVSREDSSLNARSMSDLAVGAVIESYAAA